MDFFLLYPILLLKHILDDYQLIKPAGISVIKPQYMAIFFLENYSLIAITITPLLNFCSKHTHFPHIEVMKNI